MKLLSIPLIALSLSIIGCSSKSTTNDDAATQADSTTAATIHTSGSLSGCWDIENVVINDTLYARPSEISPDTKQYITFRPDSTFAIITNCNSLGGSYVAVGDSLKFGDDTFSTQMACDNMDVEDLLRQILPEVNSVDFQNDSIIRLNTPSGMYIVLRKAPSPDTKRTGK